jgi:hypothetical protein
MVYRLAALIQLREVLRCPGRSAADIGGRMVGQDIVTEHGCSQSEAVEI